MKKINLLFLLLYSLNSYSNGVLYENFAKTILNQSKESFLVVVERNLQEVSKNSIRGEKPILQEVFSISYNLNLFVVRQNFCNKILPVIICDSNFLISSNNINSKNSLSFFENDLWLLILQPVFKEDRENISVVNSKFDDSQIEKIKNSKYITYNSFFRIPNYENDNAICLFRNKIISELPNIKPVPYKEDLVEDVQLLSTLFCDRRDNPFKALGVEELELVTKVMSNLKSEEGTKIAEAMISIIEDEIIKRENRVINYEK